MQFHTIGLIFLGTIAAMVLLAALSVSYWGTKQHTRAIIGRIVLWLHSASPEFRIKVPVPQSPRRIDQLNAHRRRMQ